MRSNYFLACGVAALVLAGAAAAQAPNQAATEIAQKVQQRASSALKPGGESNEQIPSPKRLENSYPLASDSAREKTTKLLQQIVVDLLATVNNYKEAHWNLSGPLYLPLHEFYDEQAAIYLDYTDVFAERIESLAYSVDGRYATIARTTTIPNMPAGYMSDNTSLHLLIDRVTVLQKEVYSDITKTEESDPTTSNQLQELAADVDHNLWQLRIHLQQPGGTGQNLPWAQ